MSFSSKNLVCHVPSVLRFQIPLTQHTRWLLISEGVIKAVAVMTHMRSFLFFLTIYVLEGINLSVYNIYGSNMRASEPTRHVRGRHAATHDF